MALRFDALLGIARQTVTSVKQQLVSGTNVMILGSELGLNLAAIRMN